MVKGNQTVIEEFNDIVNMSASDLEAWLKESSSQDAGWSKGDESGETIGHERHASWRAGGVFPISPVFLHAAGRKIIEILKKNPDKDPSLYDHDDIDHMRRVVAYCKRHLAQEGKAKQGPESKSSRSLKNWGHDPQKA
ncbi:Uu.00g068950.m01.CDS01 [Anthostomella pinea]|uniref:Uu.00g068950.m01.CDS01 n=1 Tax=Anthostomella pinea TaxID=933095 RepID=A0AAI8YNK1_9PEZI|nr:Uu.00g068950.m01.CDS01 [Anthostomella pinea]